MAKNKNKAKGSAPGPYLGYALQPVRALFHLLSCPPDAFVGVEQADDVSIHQSNGKLLVEQCKSALKQSPITDWSGELWKTFANWGANAISGIYDPETTQFRLYVTPVKKSARFAKRLSEAKGDIDIDSALSTIAKALEDRPTPPACADVLQEVLGMNDKTLKSIIRNFELINVDSDPLSPIYNHLDPTVRKAIIEEACKWGLGKVANEIAEKIRSDEEILISASAFRHSLKAFLLKYDAAGVLQSLVDTPSDQVVTDLVSKAPTFIQQLEIVNAAPEIKTAAASDYLQSSADRTHWAAQGLIFETSGDEYDSALKQRYQNVKGTVDISQASLSDEKRGLLIYHTCCTGEPGKLQGREVPSYFLSGSLNSIADRLEIGWHPDYLNLLGEDFLNE